MTLSHFSRGVKRKIAIFLINMIFGGVTSCWGIKRGLLHWAGFTIGVNTKIVGPITINGHLIIGESTWVGTGFKVHGNGNVIIGDNCDIAPDVTFLTGSHEIGGFNRRAGNGKNFTIEVKSGTWIGARTTIVGDLVIHESSVIGAGALVNKDVKSNTLVVGVPAKYVKKLCS